MTHNNNAKVLMQGKFFRVVRISCTAMYNLIAEK